MNKRVSDSNTISEPFQRGWAKIRIRSVSPQWLWRCRSSGYWQLCSLWFEYDLCLNRKPPSDHKSCLMTLIRIRSTSDPKGLSCGSNMIKKSPSGFGIMPIKWVSIAMFSLVRIRPMFEQEAPKWSWLDSDMIISQTKGKAGFRYDPLPVGSFHHLIKKTYKHFEEKRIEVLLYCFI